MGIRYRLSSHALGEHFCTDFCGVIDVQCDTVVKTVLSACDQQIYMHSLATLLGQLIINASSKDPQASSRKSTSTLIKKHLVAQCNEINRRQLQKLLILCPSVKERKT